MYYGVVDLNLLLSGTELEISQGKGDNIYVRASPYIFVTFFFICIIVKKKIHAGATAPTNPSLALSLVLRRPSTNASSMLWH